MCGKRFAALFAVLCVLCGIILPCRADTAQAEALLSAPAVPPPAVSAASMVLMDRDSGRVLAARDENTRRPMASTTKIMTALIVLETAPLDRVVAVPPEAVGVEGSSMYLYKGERISVETLLYGLMLSSANDAAVTLAVVTAGSVPAFAARMNEKAAALGLCDTHFVNPHGLPANDHYTTARELAILTAAALQNDTFAAIVGTVRHTAPQDGTGAERLFLNHNRLLRSYPGAAGVKTGYTRAAGRCLVSAAVRDGLSLIAVTLNDGNDWRDHAALFDWGFSQFARVTLSIPAVTLPVTGGVAETVTLVPAGTPALTLAKDQTVRAEIAAPHFLWGGINAGETCGTVTYYMEETLLATVPLTAAESVPRREKRTLRQRIRDVFK